MLCRGCGGGNCALKVVPAASARDGVHLVLSAEDLAQIEDAVPVSDVAGTRYDEHQMRILDSER